jgi:cellulose synthase/poly-beta-1,6-N-acetylglucosamine synthase-like glycosyltransferase
MDTPQADWRRVIARALVVSSLGIGAGLLFYGLSVFVPTMRASQFTTSGISIGLAYAALRSHVPRNGLAALFVWYALLTGLIENFNSWLLILNAAYIGGMAGATYVHERVVRTRRVRGPIPRIALAGAFMSIANGLIVVVLVLVSWRTAIFTHVATWIETAYFNLQIGALIGLATGLGMELAEYVDATFLTRQDETDQEKAATTGVAT